MTDINFACFHRKLVSINKLKANSEPKQGATEDGQTAGSSIHVHGQISVPCGVGDFEVVRIILKRPF
jgi:hypothetical protein